MVIAIHTINDDSNFGNRLQNYALQRVLNDRIGFTRTLQDYQLEAPENANYYSFYKELGNTWVGVLVRTMLKSHGKSEFIRKYKENQRTANFRRFTKKYVPKLPKKLNNNVDVFVIGSDQIWNPNFRENIQSDFLPGVPREKKISYAASVGIELDPGSFTVISRGAATIGKVSVREFSAKNFLDSNLVGDVSVVADPTFLLTTDEWRTLSLKTKVRPVKKYVLTYFLGRVPSETEKYIDNYAHARGLEIIHLNQESSELYSKIGPIEFLYLFDNSEAIFADSYHAAVFSLIFEKNFEIFNRVDTNIVKSMNTRMETLFQVFSLDSRLHLVGEYDPMEAVNYETLTRQKKEWRDNSLRWLINAIND